MLVGLIAEEIYLHAKRNFTTRHKTLGWLKIAQKDGILSFNQKNGRRSSVSNEIMQLEAPFNWTHRCFSPLRNICPVLQINT